MADIQSNNDLTYDAYLEPDIDPFVQQILATTAITNINGLTGPTITFSGGTSGFSFTPAGATLTLTSPLTTKGDLLVRDATTGIRLGVGADGQVLTADAASTPGIKWATPTTGTVTSVSVVSANGFAGTVATATTTPAITLTTTVSGVLKGNGTAISAAASADIITALGYTPTDAAVVPSTAPSAGQILVGNAGNTAYARQTVSGSGATITLSSAGVITISNLSLTTAVTGTLPVANGGTGVTTSTGSGNTVLSASPTFTGTITSGAITASQNISVTGTNSHRCYGVGAPGDANTEYIDMFHNAASGAFVLIEKSGTGSYRKFDLRTGGGSSLILQTDQSVTMPHYGAGTATFDASGNITSVSDMKLKREVRPFDRGLDEILKLSPILYGYTPESQLDQTRTDYAGFSAQDVLKAIPEAVGKNADGTLSLGDRPIIAALVNAVRELSQEVSQLREQINGKRK